MSMAPRRAALTLGFANGVNALSQGSLIAVVAFFSDATAVGSLSAAIAVTTPIMFFVQGRVQDLIATSGETVTGTLATLRRMIVTGVLWGSAGALALGLVFRLSTGGLLAVLFLSLARGSEARSQLSYGYSLHLGDPGRVARSLVWRSVLTLMFAIPLLWIWPSAAAAGASLFAAWSLVYLVHDRPVMPKGLSVEGVDPRVMRGHSRRLGGVQALSALIPSIPRLGLLVVGTAADLGRFAVTDFIARTVVPVSLAGAQALGPTIAAQQRDGEPPRALRQAILLNGGIALLWLPVGFFTIRQIMPRVLGSDYAISTFATLAVLIATSALVVSVALDQAAIAAKQTWRHLAILMSTAITCLVATLSVIPLSAIDGAAFALLAANLFRLGAMIVLWRRRVAGRQPR